MDALDRAVDDEQRSRDIERLRICQACGIECARAQWDGFWAAYRLSRPGNAQMNAALRVQNRGLVVTGGVTVAGPSSGRTLAQGMTRPSHWIEPAGPFPGYHVTP